MERRKHPRFRTKFDALCSDGQREGAGLLVDLSRSGARLVAVNELPEVGSRVQLYIFIHPVSPFELSGEVVRHDGKSFSIRYADLDPEIGRLVDDVAALVGGL